MVSDLVAKTILCTAWDFWFWPNQLIEVDEQTINALVGQVDPHPDAVAYCEGLK